MKFFVVVICSLFFGTASAYAVDKPYTDICSCVTQHHDCAACRFTFCKSFSTPQQADAEAYKDLNSGVWTYHCNFSGTDEDGDYYRNCSDLLDAGFFNAGMYVSCADCNDTDGDGQCDDTEDTDGDGIPDSRDPCPNNPDPNCKGPDTDGDGTPDNEDPCPANPDPNCKDPNDPPKPPPPDIPGEIVIGDCTVDITSLKAWLLSDDSFPFNFMWRIYSIFSPLFSMEPQAPVIETAIPLDPSSKYSWIPDSYAISINFSFLDPIALVVRQLEILGMAYIFALYGFHRYRSFAGV